MSTPDSPQIPTDAIAPAGSSLARVESGPAKLAAASAIAIVLVWLVMLLGEYPFLRDPPGALPPPGSAPPPPTPEEQAAMERRAYLNLAAVMAMSGGFIGVGIAFASGVRRRPIVRASLPAFVAALAGSGAGMAAAWCGERMLELPGLMKLDQWTPGTRDAVIQGACWGLVGFGVATGLTLSACRHPRSLLGGALGGMICAPLYVIVAAIVGIFLPAAEIAGVVPASTPNRLLWLLTAAVCIGGGIGINRKDAGRSAGG